MVEQENDVFTSPNWRDNGATYIIINSLDEVVKTLNLMIREGRIANHNLIEHYVKYPYYDEDAFPEQVDGEALGEFSEICGRFLELEHKLECSARTAILMAAIDLEASVNKFCFYNEGVK